MYTWTAVEHVALDADRISEASDLRWPIGQAAATPSPCCEVVVQADAWAAKRGNGELLFWDARCPGCGGRLRVFND